MSQDAASQRPVVINRSDVAKYDGKHAVVIGIYEAVEMPSKVPSLPENPRPKDYARVILEDGAIVYLEPYDTPEARRSDAERHQFNLKRVRVTGTLHRHMPSHGESLISPCLSKIVEIVED